MAQLGMSFLLQVCSGTTLDGLTRSVVGQFLLVRYFHSSIQNSLGNNFEEQNNYFLYCQFASEL